LETAQIGRDRRVLDYRFAASVQEIATEYPENSKSGGTVLRELFGNHRAALKIHAALSLPAKRQGTQRVFQLQHETFPASTAFLRQTSIIDVGLMPVVYLAVKKQSRRVPAP
jgi:hypothetical protein